MTSQEIITYTIYFIVVAIHLVALFITSEFVVPLQKQQANVKNGLIKLRQQMLVNGRLFQIIQVTTILALTLRFFVSDPAITRVLILGVLIVHALSMLGKVIIHFRIYHAQFSEENKDLHDRMDKFERGKISN